MVVRIVGWAISGSTIPGLPTASCPIGNRIPRDIPLPLALPLPRMVSPEAIHHVLIDVTGFSPPEACGYRSSCPWG